MYVIYGRGPTTIALLLLTPLIFVGQGLQSIVPSNIALGISFFLWAIILQKNERLHWILLPLLIAALLMHQIGRLYGLIALGLYVATANFPLSRKDRLFLISGLALTALTFVAPALISSPELSSDTGALYPVPWNYIEAMIESIRTTTWPLIEFWFRPLGSAVIALLLITFCVLILTRQKRKNWLITAALLIPFLIFSIVYVDPWYGPLVFERAWVPMGIFLTGALGLVIFVLGRTVLILGKRLVRGQRRRAVTAKMRPSLLWFIAALVLSALAFKQLVFDYIPYYIRHYELTLAHQIDRLDFRLDASQPELIHGSRSSHDQTVIYMHRVPLYYYLSHGAQHYGALFYPALVESQLEEAWVQASLAEADFLVAANPVYAIQERPEMEVEVDDNAELSIEGVAKITISSFKVFVAHEGQPIELEIEWRENGEPHKTTSTIADDTFGWVTLSQDEIEANQVAITVIGNRGLTIRGISFEDEPVTNWPWAPGILLTLTPAAGDPVYMELSEASLIQNLPIDIVVIDDDGMTILARVLH